MADEAGERKMREMKKYIHEGNIGYENSSLDFSCAKLELTITKGEVREGSFQVYSTGGEVTNGFVSTTDSRMECLTEEFSGSREDISFRFHGEYLEEGDVIKGNFSFVSNQGEYHLPFVVSVEHCVLESSVGHVKNLFHFANLAKSSWEEAVRLFYKPEFARVFEGSDKQYYNCYRGLCAYPDNEQNVEEFLIQINKKNKVDYLVREEKISVEFDLTGTADMISETDLNIVRNGWGYTSLQVECDGDFVFTEKECLTDNDFLGNKCALPVFIDRSLCRRGKNFGSVYLYNSYVSLTIPVVVKVGELSADGRQRRERKRIISELMCYYMDFRMRKIAVDDWMTETGKLIDKLVAQNEEDIAARLFQAQLFISQERNNEAEWLLHHVEDLLEEEQEEDDTLRAYYLYLTTLLRREETYVDKVTEQVEYLFRRDRTNWRIAWLLLYLSEEYHRTAEIKWNFLEKQFSYGCISPVLYIEALNLLNSNPSMLRKLNSYTLQVLNYGVKQYSLNPEIQEQLLYLTGKGKVDSPVLLKVLIRLYDYQKDVRVLQEICTILIRLNCRGEAYFEWYQAGVDKQLRITNLYEHYISSLNMENVQTIPNIVLRYFSYQNNLDYVHSAFLFDYVLKHRDELGDIYEGYRSRMESFVTDQLQKMRIDRYLANLYQHLFTPALVNRQTAEPLARLVFAHQIHVKDSRMRKVIVYQPGNLQESVYPIQDGVATVFLYGNDCTVLFEDAYHNRFIKSVEHTVERMMSHSGYLKILAQLVDNLPEFDIYLLGIESENHVTPEMLARIKRLADSEHLEKKFRNEIELSLLKHYYDTDQMGLLESRLREMDLEKFSGEEREQILRYMVLRGQNDTAWNWVVKFGPGSADAKTLLRLVGELIAAEEAAEDRQMAEAALCVFRSGKYDSRVIRYLEKYAEGTTRELRNIWKAARSYAVDCYGLSERMIVQMLYSGAFIGEKMEIFDYYTSRGADREIVESFLGRCSYEYFVKERVTEGLVFAEIEQMYRQFDEVHKICKLAFLKYYSENTGEITEGIAELIAIFVRELLAERIYLNCFRSFRMIRSIREQLLLEMQDKTIIEYRGRPGARMRIHYVIVGENGEESDYLAEPLRDVYGGMCFKEFILFFGETLQYYITEEWNGEEQLTESGNVQRNDETGDTPDGRYEMINDIVISKTLQDYDTMNHLLKEYYHREYLTSRLFQLK